MTLPHHLKTFVDITTIFEYTILETVQTNSLTKLESTSTIHLERKNQLEDIANKIQFLRNIIRD